jgi:release factor glutamine methyltransferase
MEWTTPAGRKLFVPLHGDVYRPAEDTFLLARAVHEHVERGSRVLEVGCGTGLVALTAAAAGAHVTATDANPHAVAVAQEAARQNRLPVEVVQADLMEGVGGPFDVVAFNPPYLPTAPDEYVPGPLNLAFDGGPDGNQTVLRFVGQLAKLRPRPATVLVVHSTLSDPAPLRKAMAALGYHADVAAEEGVAFERLTVQRFRR